MFVPLSIISEKDALWNYGAFVIMGMAGVGINFVLGWLRGVEALGLFSQTYAIYVVASQLSVGAIHQSTLVKCAAATSEGPPPQLQAVGGLAAVFFLSLLVAALLLSSSGPLATLMNSPALAESLKWAALALIPFSFNKVLLGALNGLKRLRTLALLQSLRSVSLVIWVLVLAGNGSAGLVGAAFLCCETSVLLFSLPAFFVRPPAGASWLGIWPIVRDHLSFGARGLISGVLQEANIRIDILCLGLLLEDTAVGIYALAGAVAEGFLNLLIVLRTMLAPTIITMLRQGGAEAVFALLRSFFLRSISGAALAALILWMGFLVAFQILPIDGGRGAMPILAILLFGMVLYSSVQPFDLLLLQADRPQWQSIFAAMTVASNVVLNFLMIPMFGPTGAALATALSFALSIVYFNLLAAKILGRGQFPFSPPTK